MILNRIIIIEKVLRDQVIEPNELKDHNRLLKVVFAKNERGYRLNAIKKRF